MGVRAVGERERARVSVRPTLSDAASAHPLALGCRAAMVHAQWTLLTECNQATRPTAADTAGRRSAAAAAAPPADSAADPDKDRYERTKQKTNNKKRKENT